MNIFKKFIAIMFIASGISIIAFPWAKALYFNNIQNKVMRLWQETVDNNEIQLNSEFNNSDFYETDVSVKSNIDENIETQNDVWTENTNRVFDLEYVKNNMEGIISIDKIKLKSPILKNASSYNLDIAICSVANTGKMGEIGNYVLAGHKSRIYGRHFNRLEEVSVGDKIVVENGINSFEYFVTKILSVTPTETWVMENNGDDKLLTLITCDYRTNPVNRLIVVASLQ